VVSESLPDWVVDEFADFHRRTVHRMLARAHTLADRHSAEDLVQDAYVLAVRGWVGTLRGLEEGQRLSPDPPINSGV